MGRKILLLTGLVYGRLTVINQPIREGKKTYYDCVCSCGTRKRIVADSLRNGSSRSCGCLSAELARERALGRGATTAEIRRTRVSWKSMIERCHRPQSGSYARYGGLGITVCERWRHSFKDFLKDMGERPENTTLDRIDRHGNYEPENCRWATRQQQNRNHAHAAKITFQENTLSFAEWAEITGIPASVIRQRIRYSCWPVDKALMTPVM